MDYDDLTPAIKEELISLKHDIELKPKFKETYQSIWLQHNISERYPLFRYKVKLLLIAFHDVLVSRTRI